MYTPDAQVHRYIEYPSTGPGNADGANLRAVGELDFGRTWKTFDLTLRLPLPQLAESFNEYPRGNGPDVLRYLVHQRWDFYFALPEHQPWFFGLGFELAFAPAVYGVVTHELGGAGALTLTGRAITGGDSALNAQLAWVAPGAHLSLFAALFQPLGGDMEIRNFDYGFEENDYTHAGTFALFGLSGTYDR